MSKARFVCQSCGALFPRWEGRCSHCGAWHSIVEEAQPNPLHRIRRKPPPVAKLSEVSPSEEGRLNTGIKEFDRVLGGGIVRDSVVLIAGEPGVGKSTLLLQVAGNVARQGYRVLYVSGEESLGQLKERADRLSLRCEPIHVLSETSTEAIEAACEDLSPALVVIDSAQTLRTETCMSSPGTVECANPLRASLFMQNASFMRCLWSATLQKRDL